MTAVHGLPVAGLIRSSVQVSLIPGVMSVTLTCKLPFDVRYTAEVIVTTSWIGFTATLTLPTAVSPDVELFAVTANVSVFGALPAGTVGARKVCCDPLPFAAVNVIPAGATHV